MNCLLRYSINGHFLDRLKLDKQVISTPLVTAHEYLIYGTTTEDQCGNLYVREIHRCVFDISNKVTSIFTFLFGALCLQHDWPTELLD